MSAKDSSKTEAKDSKSTTEEKVTSAPEDGQAAAPDQKGQEAVEAHREQLVIDQKGAVANADTGDDSAVHPQPDRDTVNEQTNFKPLDAEKEFQPSEQPDRYAVGDEAVEYVTPKRRGRPRKTKDGEDESSVESPSWPAQYEGDPKDHFPPQYSW